MQIRIRKKDYLLISMLCLLMSCGCQTNGSDIKSIHVEYYNYLFESPIQIGCEEIRKTAMPNFEKIFVYSPTDPSIIIDTIINYEAVLDTIIKDQIILANIEKQLTLLRSKTTTNNDIDARIAAIIKYKNGKEDKLCIGGYLGDVISFNGKIQQPNRELLYLIKSSIGYYNWIPRKEISYMDELNDSTFMRDQVGCLEDNPLFN